MMVTLCRAGGRYLKVYCIYLGKPLKVASWCSYQHAQKYLCASYCFSLFVVFHYVLVNFVFFIYNAHVRAISQICQEGGSSTLSIPF